MDVLYRIEINNKALTVQMTGIDNSLFLFHHISFISARLCKRWFLFMHW